MYNKRKRVIAFALSLVVCAGMTGGVFENERVFAAAQTQEILSAKDNVASTATEATTQKESTQENTTSATETSTTQSVTTTTVAATTTAVTATTEAASLYIRSVSYNMAQVKKGDTLKVSVQADAPFSRIRNQQLHLTFTNRTDATAFTVDAVYQPGTHQFEGQAVIDAHMSRGVYALTEVSYEDQVNGSTNISKISDAGLSTFEKMDEAENVLVESITLSAQSMSMKVNAVRQINAQVQPDNAANPQLDWSSSKESVATVDATGTVTAKAKGTAVITAKATDGSGVTAQCKIKVTANLVIVLDPGHGRSDFGAINHVHRLYEKNVNLQIAQACRDYLEQYEGVAVYLTRETNSGFLGLEERAKFAKACDADVFISVHINASLSKRATGAEVWVTRSTYKARYNKAMKALGSKILNNLGSYGFKKRGVYTRKSSHLRYSFDHKIADYYGVIRSSIERDIPAMIVEHGYIDSQDYKLMNTAAKTKKIGIADAKAIASYYGLTKRTDKVNPIEVTGIKLNCNETVLSLKKGKSYQLKATVVPKNAKNRKVSYSSSNSSVVKVSASGKITAKKKGTATVTCTADDNSGMARKLKVKVN